MSTAKRKQSGGKFGAKGGGGARNGKYQELDSKSKTEITRKLFEMFRESFDVELVASVAHTCQWDFGRAAEALMILGGCSNPISKKSKHTRGSHRDSLAKNEKTKSLPSSLKQSKKDHLKESSSMHGSMNGLKPHSAHQSTNSLTSHSGQVWQRHYKSKPQSPGLLTMIPPQDKKELRIKKTGSVRSLPTMSPKAKESPEVKQLNESLLRIQHLVQNKTKVMVLMRGAPGSGKTYLASLVVASVTTNDPSQHIFSTDDYFIMIGRGTYRYDAGSLPQAHNWNQKRVSEALRRSTNPVIVDNTHSQAWEMQPYVAMAVQHGYLIEVLEPSTPWKNKEAELARKNVHFVPREKIRQMLERYEVGWTGDRLLELFGLKYLHCGKSHVPQEITSFSNSPLAQHRQHDVIQVPEKPKRKRNSPKKTKKDRKIVPGVEITEDKEKQLEELNKLFAEYGKTMDPVSKQKVLESGVPISEVVARMRKLQGTVLPIPESSPRHTSQPSGSGVKTEIRPIVRISPSDSVEPDTFSSCNLSETSETWESDSEMDIKCGGTFMEGEDDWEDAEDDNMCKSEGAISNKQKSKHSSLVTSSQEELSLIDFETSTPAASSQEELSLLDFEESSSSEEQETQMLTLQESLKEMLINKEKELKQNGEKQLEPLQLEPFHPADPDTVLKKYSKGQPQTLVELNESLINLIKKHNETYENQPENDSSLLNPSLLDLLGNKYKKEPENRLQDFKITVVNNEPVKSPDLEQIPLPSIPEAEIFPKPSKMDEIMNTWEDPSQVKKDYSTPKPERIKPETGAVPKKVKDESPDKILTNAELSWTSVPFTSSWENISKKPVKPPIAPKPQRLTTGGNKSDVFTNTTDRDFTLWQTDLCPILKVTSRDINKEFKEPKPLCIPTILMLDKGSMTEEVDESSEEESKVKILQNVFPSVANEYLVDLLNKCEGNVDWVVDLLLESNQESLAAAHANQQSLTAEVKQEPIVAQEFLNEKVDVDLAKSLDGIIGDGKKTIKRNKKTKTANSDVSLLLKKQLEESITIGENHYAERTLYLKKLKHGEFEEGETSQEQQQQQQQQQPEIPDPSELEEIIKETTPTSDVPDEETLAMELNPEFLNTLVQKFGVLKMPFSNSGEYTPTVNIPISLASQIYSYWLESVNQQIEEMDVHYDNMVKEDEQLASALQQQEFADKKPDLREIMDMEMALALHKEDQVLEQ